MGDRYFWDQPCQQCGENIEVYYAPSCEMTTARCFKCGAEYDIVQTHSLVKRDIPQDGGASKS